MLQASAPTRLEGQRPALAGRGLSESENELRGLVSSGLRVMVAFPHRGERFSVQVLSYTASVQVARARVRRARARIAPYGSGAYANYADPDLSNALGSYYGANLSVRLIGSGD